MQTYDEDILILRPVIHITQAGREYRNIMRRIWRACNFWINCPKDRQKIYGDIGEMFYNLALILDDVEDYTILRRGIPTAHMVYGIPLTVHATIYKTVLLFQDLLYHLEDRKDVVTDGLIRVGIETLTGQGIEIYYRDIVECPTLDDYKAVGDGKLFANKKKVEFNFDFLDKLGQFIQIYDDYINLHNPKWATVRVYCDDLDEGKFSFPIIHAIQSHPHDHRLLNMLKNRPLDNEKKKLFVDIMESFGSFEYTRKVLEDLKNGILQEIGNMKLKQNPQLERVLEDIFSRLDTEIFIDICN